MRKDKPVSEKDRKIKPGDKRIAFWARSAAHFAEETKKTDGKDNKIPVTVQNVSTHNCTGGTVTLKCSSTGEIARTTFGPIADGHQATNDVYMTSWPDTIGWYFSSNEHVHWGPVEETYPSGALSVTLPLDPE